MSQVTESQKRRSRITAAMAVAVVAALSLSFIGLILILDSVAGPVRREGPAVVEVHSDEPFYVLLIGSDSRKGTALYTGKKGEHAQVDQHSDVMTLMRVDPRSYLITLVTVPRDTVLDGSDGRINDALLDGDPAKAARAVERLTGVAVPYYMMVDFTSFSDLIDALGGVVVDVPANVTVPDPMTADNVTVTAGEDQLLDGAEALVLARARKEYGDDQDALRQVNVRNIEAAIIGKVLESPNDEAVTAALLDLEENVTTNLDMAAAAFLVMDFVAHGDEVVIYSCTDPYEGGEREDGLWVVDEQPAAWDELMAVVEAGEDPSGVIPAPRFEDR